MQDENLKTWILAAWTEENTDTSRCSIFVEIIQLEFFTGELVLECTWATGALIPKGGGEYHGIGLVEVI